jgi:hypothetical protein
MNQYQNFRFNGNYLVNPFGVKDLSFCYSTIPLLIAVNIVQYFNANRPLSVKKLFSAFGCSSLTVKKYLDQLIALEYVHVVQSSSDRRVRYLEPNQRLLDLMNIYSVDDHDKKNLDYSSSD